MRNYYSFLKKITASVTIIGSGILVNHLVNKDSTPLKDAWTNTYEPSVKWDANWDRRDHISAVKRHRHHSHHQKEESKQVAENNEKPKAVDDSEIGKQTSKANRHLFLIRHGQYEIKEPLPENHVLTQMG